MRKIYTTLFIASAALMMTSCGGEEAEETNDETTTDSTDTVEEVVEEIVEPEAPELSDFILGKWSKVAQNCDENGENCDYNEGSDWDFDGTQVTLGKVSQDYTVVNDTIYIVDSPYVVAMEMGDTILLHGVAKGRFMKLVRQ
jgi:hypothetical protein